MAGNEVLVFFVYTSLVNGQAVGKMNLEFFRSCLFTMTELLEFFRAVEVGFLYC